MSVRWRWAQAAVAGIVVALADLWPTLLIWRAGASGSVGDLREVRALGLGLAWSLVLGLLAGWAMAWALPRAAASAHLGRWDPWGAWALGLGMYLLLVTAGPALLYGVLLVDEGQSLRSREWVLGLAWVGGHLLAALFAVLAARGVLGRGLGQDHRPTATDGAEARPPAGAADLRPPGSGSRHPGG